MSSDRTFVRSLSAQSACITDGNAWLSSNSGVSGSQMGVGPGVGPSLRAGARRSSYIGTDDRGQPRYQENHHVANI
jgi:hypothetical protein